MSSLRLALKQSLEESGVSVSQKKTSNDRKKRDKERRRKGKNSGSRGGRFAEKERRKRLKIKSKRRGPGRPRKEEYEYVRDEEDEDDEEGVEDGGEDSRKRAKKMKRRRERELRRKQKLQQQELQKQRNDSLESHLEDVGSGDGTRHPTIHLEAVGDGTIHGEHRKGSISSSTLSSSSSSGSSSSSSSSSSDSTSSSGSSSSDDGDSSSEDDEDNGSLSSNRDGKKGKMKKKKKRQKDEEGGGHSSASSSSSGSSSDSSDDDDDDDDDDDLSSDSDGFDNDDDNNSDSSSEDSHAKADKEAKELFDADLSSEDEEDDNDKANRRRERVMLKKKQSKLQAKKAVKKQKRNAAANMIQTHWKKKQQSQKADEAGGEQEEDPMTPTKDPSQEREEEDVNRSSMMASPMVLPGRMTPKTVQPPTQEVMQWIREMSQKKQRKNVAKGLRVKVRFVKETSTKNVHGRKSRKLKWYGGVIDGTNSGGRRIKIKYDDGTAEIAEFPDKDIIIDAVDNGRHRADAHAFIPPPQLRDDSDGDDEKSDEEEGEVIGSDESLGEPAISERSSELKASKNSKVSESPGYGDKNVSSSHTNSSIQLTSSKDQDELSIPKALSKDTPMDEVTPHCNASKRDSELKGEKGNATPDHHDEPSKEAEEIKQSFMAENNPKEKSNLRVIKEKEADDECKHPSVIQSSTTPVQQKPGDDDIEQEVSLHQIRNKPDDKTFPSHGSSQDIVQVKSKAETQPNQPPIEKSPPLAKQPDGLDNGKSSSIPPNLSPKDGEIKAADSGGSSSSGSTCSSASFAPPSNIAAPKKPFPSTDFPSRVNVEGVGIKRERSFGDISPHNAEMKEKVAKDEKNPENSLKEPVKKPRIKIGLPGAKRKKIEEELKAKKRPLSDSDPDSNEPLKKKEKASFNADVVSSKNEKPNEQDVPTAKLNGDSIVEISEVDAESHEPDTLQPASSQGDLSSLKPLQSKKPTSLKIHIKTKAKRRDEKGQVVEVLNTPRPQQSAEDQCLTKNQKELLKSDAEDAANQPSSKQAKLSHGAEDQRRDPEKRPSHSDGDTSIGIPLNSAASLTTDISSLQDDKTKLLSAARAGRNAAKKAADRIAEKKTKPKKKGKGIVEEDPWVQCDRCQKWRHLPAYVNLEDLPEHWFCELNTYDEKRNDCEAPEQTPKEVAKEKKRAKKLAAKLQLLEQKQLDAEGDAISEKRPSKSASEEESEFDSRKQIPSSPQTNEDLDHASTDSKDNVARSTSPKNVGDDASPTSAVEIVKKPKRGRPSNKELMERRAAAAKEEKSDNKLETKQEWVQCEKCEKWRRLPPRISASDLPDVWYCSMNTWDINLATCTAVEDKHEASTKEKERVNTGIQLPTPGTSGGKLSYRNLILGNGRRQKNISERMRAQESLFSSQQEEESCDMSMPPTVMYANSNAFFHKNLPKTSSLADDVNQPSVFDIMAHSHAWKELSNNAAYIREQSTAAYNSVGYVQYCKPDGTLNEQTIHNLKAMAIHALGSKALAGHEVLLEMQCRHWTNVPSRWLELRHLCTIEIVTYILDELLVEGVVELVCDRRSLTLDKFLYRKKSGSSAISSSPHEIFQQRSSCLKLRKPWR
ncbi:hypothetical protein ACHAXS_014361 [Conticribra weissflogii]